MNKYKVTAQAKWGGVELNTAHLEDIPKYIKQCEKRGYWLIQAWELVGETYIKLEVKENVK